MKKIFVSSTYTDLIQHRKNVWQLLKNYDVEITGMEEFGARTSAPLETCINYAKECDIYLGIISMRYGSIDKNSGKSFTQIEYETALKNRKEILIYLFDEFNGLTRIGNIDFENYKKLDSFKTLLKRRHTVDSFVNEKELVKKINKRISELILRKNLKLRRPRSIDATVTRFKVSNELWIAIVGYLFGMPFEIYLAKEENYYLPKWVSEGLITKNTTFNPKGSRFDFQFMDKQGYKVISEGVSRSFGKSINSLNTIISRLLKKETDLDEIISFVNDMELTEISNIKELGRGIKKALKK